MVRFPLPVYTCRALNTTLFGNTTYMVFVGAARVTVVGSVCLCVCPLLNISPLERLFVSQSVPHTQQAAKVRNFVWFSLKMLRCRARALPSLYSYALVGHFYSATYARAHND